MSLALSYAQMDAYCRDYFDSPIHLLAQTKPDEWARSYLKSWLGHDFDVASDEAFIQTCHQILTQHDQYSWIKGLWQRIFSPISQLKTYHAMLVLRHTLNEFLVNQTPQHSKRLETAYINARMHREVWFWIYCWTRWLIGASNPWTTKGLSIMNEQSELDNHLPTIAHPPQPLSNAQQSILNVLNNTQSKLITYGTRRGKKNFLVGEPLNNKTGCANKIGLISRDACLQARGRIIHRDSFQTIAKQDMPRILFQDQLTYYRALEEEIKTCQLILADDFNQLIDPTTVLTALESLLALIQEGFYVNQYIYSTHHLSANEPLGRVWEIYNALPQQLRTSLQTCPEYTPDWLTPWIAQVDILTNHMQLLTEKSPAYSATYQSYNQINETIQKLDAGRIPTTWLAITTSFLSLEQKRQAAYNSDRLNLDKLFSFFNEWELFKNQLQLFIDNEKDFFIGLKKNTPIENNTSYIDQAFSLYDQSTNFLSNALRAVYPRISSDNPFLTQMKKEIQAYRRIQIEQQRLNQTWDETLRYKYTREDYTLLKQQLNLLNAQLNELGQQQAIITPLMQAWRQGDDLTSIEQQMTSWALLRSYLDDAQGDYQTNFNNARLVPVDSLVNPLIDDDLLALNLTKEHPITKQQLNQQYKKLSLQYHPDKHRSDAMPRCDFLWLNSLTKKPDILDYYARVSLDDATYIFVEKTGELLYASSKSYQIELVGIYSASFFAALAANGRVNMPLLLTEQQIELIERQAHHSHRTQYWQIKTNHLQAAYKRLLTSEQGLDVDEWEKSNAEVREKLRREVQQLREKQIETKTTITEQLAATEKRLDAKIAKVFAKVEQQNATEIAKFNEQHATKIAKLSTEVSDLSKLVHKLLNQNTSTHFEPLESNGTQSNYF